MKLTNNTGGDISYDGYTIRNAGDAVEVDKPSAIDWLTRHGCTPLVAVAPESTVIEPTPVPVVPDLVDPDDLEPAPEPVVVPVTKKRTYRRRK